MASHAFLETTGQPFVLDGGDVIIRTSTKPSGIFVVHKDALSSCSTYFEALFSQRWDQRAHPTLRNHARSGGDEPVVHELDLYLDMETKLALLTAKKNELRRTPQGILNSAQREAAASRSSSTTTEPVPDPQSPPLQFLWSEPQPETYFVLHVEQLPDAPENSIWLRDTYDKFFYAFTTSIPRPARCEVDKAAKGGFVQRHADDMLGPSHVAVIKHAQSIWMAIINLAYGRELRSARHATWRDTICFVGNLLTHAQYLGMNETVINGIGRYLLAQPRLWEEVSQRPEIFFHLAWHLRIPHLYLDAAKHLVGQNVGPRFLHGSVHRGSGLRGFSTSNPHHYNMEMMALITAGTSMLYDELLWVRRRVGFHLTLIAVDIEVRDQMLAEGSQVTLDRYDNDVLYIGVTKQLLSTVSDVIVLEAGGGDPEEEYRGFFRGLRGLNRSLIENTTEGMNSWRNVTLQAAQQHRLDPDLLWDWVALALRAVGKCLLASPLLQHPEHVCILGVLPCQRCNRSRVDSNRYFAWLDPNEVLKGMPERPWPLDEDLSETSKLPEILERTVAPASYEWLQTIGLGEPFKHLQAKSVEQIRLANNGYDCAEHNVSDMVTVSRRSRYQREQLNLELLSEQMTLLQ